MDFDFFRHPVYTRKNFALKEVFDSVKFFQKADFV